MSFEGDVSSFLRSTGKSDGLGDNGYSNFDIKSRRANVRNHYIQSGYKAKMGMDIDPETGEILNYQPPKNAKNPYNMRKGFKPHSLGAGTKSILDAVLSYAPYAIIAFVGYSLYKKYLANFLSSSTLDTVKDNAQKVVDTAYVNSDASKVTATNATTTALAAQGYTVSTLHQNLANTLYGMLDTSGIADGSKIVATIKGMSDQTFQLTSSAYGRRNLNAYAKSPTHLFTLAAWSDLFSNDKLMGTLKDHLKTVLTSSEQSQISHYLSLIS